MSVQAVFNEPLHLLSDAVEQFRAKIAALGRFNFEVCEVMMARGPVVRAIYRSDMLFIRCRSNSGWCAGPSWELFIQSLCCLYVVGPVS